MTARTCLTLALILVARPIRADDPKPDDSPRPATLKRMEWKVGDVTREALVHVPEVAKDAPLVFVWHGHGGTMRQASLSFGIHKLWPEAIVVYAQGLPTVSRLVDPEGKRPGWQVAPDQSEDRDLKFFDAMLESLKADLKPDPRRIFSTGHSNGGRFTYLLWATRPDTFAAFAPSASPATGLLVKMKPKPCLHVAGEADTLVTFASQQRTMDQVKKLNGCEAEGKRWDEFQDKVTLYPSPGGTPLVTAINPGGHVFSREAPRAIVKFFKNPTGR